MNAEHFALLWPAPLWVALLYVLTACRFLAYRPNGGRHRWAISLAACVLSAALLCRAVELVHLAQVSAPEAVIIVWLCVAAWRSHGNLADFFRGPRHG